MKIAVIYSHTSSETANLAANYINDLGGFAITMNKDFVSSIQKANLVKGEVPNGRSRFLDLFRIVYRLTPSEIENDETIKGYKEEDIKHLQSEIENYIDIDSILLIDSDEVILRKPVCLNESIYQDHISYVSNLQGNDLSDKDIVFIPNIRDIELDELDFEVLVNLGIKLVFQNNPLEIRNYGQGKFIDHYSNYLNEEEERYLKEVSHWEGLDLIEKRRTPKPMRSEAEFRIYFNCLCRSIEKMSNSKDYFVTIEEKSFQNDEIVEDTMMKTFGTQRLWILGEQETSNQSLALESSEKGVIKIRPFEFTNSSNLSEKDFFLEELEKELRILFSPA